MPDERCYHPREERELVAVYLSLGSNLGDREKNIAKALELLTPKVLVDRTSFLYETEPVGYSEQPRFLNAVCRGETELTPWELLDLVKEIEEALGRVPSFPNAPRPIDIDIVFYADQVINSPRLTIPHPRLEERAFVLIPLAEIAPDLVHPVSRRKVRELVKEVRGLQGVRKWKEG